MNQSNCIIFIISELDDQLVLAWHIGKHISPAPVGRATFTVWKPALHLHAFCVSMNTTVSIVMGSVTPEPTVLWEFNRFLKESRLPAVLRSESDEVCNMNSLWSEKWLEDESSAGSTSSWSCAIRVIISQCRTFWSFWHLLFLIIPSLIFSGGGPRGPRPSC